MVKNDGTITAVVDWDSTGWIPEYWEYTKLVSNIMHLMIVTMNNSQEGRLCTLCGYSLAELSP